MSAKPPPVFGVTGWKNSGKTTLVAKLVSEFTQRNLKVSTIKHAHHSFDIDHEDTDSWKHRKAGAGEVALVSKNRWALMHELIDEEEPPLNEILQRLSPCDLIIIEGFKQEGHPKIEIIRKETLKDEALWPNDRSIEAIVSNDTVDSGDLPVFSPEDIRSIADFIAMRLSLDISERS